REIKFDLPNYEARKRILQIHCSKLPKAPEESVIEFLAANTIQFCGADLKELCNQAALNFIKRSFPKIYGSNKRLKIAPIKDSCPTAQDYIASLEIVRPNSSKISSTDADFVASPRNLPRPLNLLFEDECKRLMEMLRGKYLIQDKTNLALLKNSQHMLSQRCGQNSTTILLEDSLNTFNRTMISLLGNDKPGFMQFFLPQLLADIEERSKNVVYLDLLNVSCFAQENSRSSANTMRQLIDKAASEKHSILVVNGIIEAANDDSDSSPFSSNFLTFLNYVHLWPNNQKCLILGIDSEATLEDFKKFSGNYGKIFTVAEFEYSEASETKKIDYLTEIVFAKLQVLMCLLEQLYASPIDQGAISKNAESHILKDQLNNMDEQSVALAALTSGQDEECSNEEEYDEEEALKCFRETLDDNDIKSINNNYHQMMRSLRIVLRTVLKYLLK
ncbi:MAG: TAT-binding protein-like protein 7, AAA ATPase, partial [Marteilia pararefringens]